MAHTDAAPASADPQLNDTPNDAERWPKWLGTLILPLFGAALVLFVTRDGAGVSPDARGYLMAARHLAAGKGYTILNGDGVLERLTQFPPLYAMLLAPAEMAGISAAAWSRFLNAGLFAVSIALVARLARLCGASCRVACVCAALFLLAPDLLFLHTMVLSEPLFIACALAAFVLLGGYLEGGGLWKLVLAALALAAAMGARYSAPPLIGAAALCVMLSPRRPIARRVGHALLLGVIAAVPMAAWMAYNARLTGSAGGRPIMFHPPTAQHWDDAAHTLAYWVIPVYFDQVTTLACVAVALLCVVAIVWGWRQGGTSRLVALTAGCYLAFIVLSISFVDALTPMDKRILAPAHTALIVLVPTWIATQRFLPRTVLPSMASLFLLSMIVRAGAWAHLAQTNDLGFATRQWRESELAQFVRTLPPDAVIYTNTPDFLYLGLDRFAKPIPRLTNAVTQRQDGRYRAKALSMEQELRERGGYVVYFSAIRRGWLPTEERLTGDLPLVLVRDAKDGRAYQVR